MKYKNVDPEILENRIDRLITHFEEEEKKEKSKKKPNIFQLWAIPKVSGQLIENLSIQLIQASFFNNFIF